MTTGEWIGTTDFWLFVGPLIAITLRNFWGLVRSGRRGD